MRKKFCLFGVGCALVILLMGVGQGASSPGTFSPSAMYAATAVEGECESQLSPLLRSLDALRARLAWKQIDYATFLARFRSAERIYRRLPVDQMGIFCLSGPGVNAEETVNEYAYAVMAWSECLENSACDQEAYMPVVERKWWVAGTVLSTAHKAMVELEEPSS